MFHFLTQALTVRRGCVSTIPQISFVAKLPVIYVSWRVCVCVCTDCPSQPCGKPCFSPILFIFHTMGAVRISQRLLSLAQHLHSFSFTLTLSLFSSVHIINTNVHTCPTGFLPLCLLLSLQSLFCCVLLQVT